MDKDFRLCAIAKDSSTACAGKVVGVALRSWSRTWSCVCLALVAERKTSLRMSSYGFY